MATILCIDDHTYGLASTTAMLRKQGHTLLVVDNPHAALRAIADCSVDLVLLDCHRNEHRGNMASAIRILRPEIPVIMISGYCGLHCTALHQADVCVQKGDAAMLAQTIQSVLCASLYGLCRSVAA